MAKDIDNNVQAYNLQMPFDVITEHLGYIQETFVKNKAPDLSDLDDEQLIDLLGSFRKIEAIGGLYNKTISGLLKAKLPQEQSFTASRYEFFIKVGSRTALDQTLVKEEMGDDWYEEHCKTSEVITASCRPISPEDSEGL